MLKFLLFLAKNQFKLVCKLNVVLSFNFIKYFL